MSNETNAFKGQNVEKLFKNSIDNEKEIISILQENFSIHRDSSLSKKSYRPETPKGKNDVIICFDSGEELGANVMSFSDKNSGFNQTLRMSPKNFIAHFKISQECSDIIFTSILRKAAAASSREERFINVEDEPTIVECFSKKASEIIEYSLCAKDAPQLLVIWVEEGDKMYLYKMVDFLEQMNKLIDVKISDKGVIYLNEYFTVQKKGGNGIQDKHEKTDIDHGGNNLQVKLKTSKITKELEALCSYVL